MGNYTVISEIGNSMIQLFRKNMVPDIILNPDAIGMCNPADRGDISLGIYLYDIKESEEVRVSGMVANGVREQRFPPVNLTLYYMITAYSGSDIKYRAAEEQRILGRVIQVLKDNPVVKASTLEFGQNANTDDMKVEMQIMETGEKMKFWNVPNLAYKLSLFYRVTPVMIESTRIKTVKRVTSIELRE